MRSSYSSSSKLSSMSRSSSIVISILLFAVCIRQSINTTNCLAWFTGWQSDDFGNNFTYSTCNTCSTNKYRFVNQTINLPSGPYMTYDCALCNTNCKTCQTSATNCLTCVSGKYIVSIDGIQSCGDCASNCVTCQTSSSNCIISCASGAYVASTGGSRSCELCSTNCLTCQTSATNCLTCIPAGYIVGTSGSRSCILCNTNCKTCQTSATNCLTCNVDKYVAADKTCKSCDSDLITSCVRCTLNGCTQCTTNFKLYNSLCIFDCVPDFGARCLTCSTTTCLTCEPGYVFNSASPATCVLCNLPNCQACADGPICTTCKSSNGYVFNSATPATCVLCSSLSNCQTCADGPICTTCNSGYVFNSATPATCVLCSSLPNCQTCADGPICTTCNSNFFFDIPNGNVSCVACSISNCQTCIHGPKCTICRPNFYMDLSDNLTCSSCSMISNCQTCIDGPQCTNCPTNFILSAFARLNQCIQCPFGNYASSSNQCVQCPSNCFQCKQTVSGVECTPCPPNTVLDLNAQMCLPCDTNVKNCQQCSDANTCNQCKYPYLLDDNKLCEKCESDFQYLNGYCIKPVGCRSTLPDYSKCIACSAENKFSYESAGNTCKCLLGYERSIRNGVTVCLPKCGDGILIVHDEQCDDGNLRNQDGCDDNCQRQSDFSCTDDSPTVCSLKFTSNQFEYNYAQRIQGTNRCKLSLTLAPSHPSFQLVDWANHLTFNFSEQHIVPNSKNVRYDTQSKEIIIELEYLATLENMTVEFKLFSAHPIVQSSSIEALPVSISNKTPETKISGSKGKPLNDKISLLLEKELIFVVKLHGVNAKLLYEKQSIMMAFESVQIMSLIITILILIQFFIGSCYHKMIGVETIQILQFFYFVRVIIEQTFTTFLNSMNVLKYTAYGGYSNYVSVYGEESSIIQAVTSTSVGQNFVTVELTKYFVTNVNIPLILPALSIIGFMLALARKYTKRHQYLKTRDSLLKDQYTVVKRSSQWVYDHFVFPYLNLFNMVIFFTTVLYLQFKPGSVSTQVSESQVIKFIEKTSFPPHLIMVFLTFLIYCTEVFTSLEEFHHSRLTEAEKSRVPKSLYERIEHDENNPDRANYKPGYIFVYLFSYLVIEIALMFDVLFHSFKQFGVEILCGISFGYLIFIWKWRPYNKAVEFHNRVLKLNHFTVFFFMSMNVICRRVQVSIVLYLVMVYTTIFLLLVVTICGYLRIVVEYRFRKKLLDNPNLMENISKKKNGKLKKQETGKKKYLLQNNPFLFENQVKEMLKKERSLAINIQLTDLQIEEAKKKMRKQIYSDKERMQSIQKQNYFGAHQGFVFKDLKPRQFEQQDLSPLKFKKQEGGKRRKQ